MIYTQKYKGQLYEALLASVDVKESREPLYPGTNVMTLVSRVNGYPLHVVEGEIFEENFELEGNLLTLPRLASGDNIFKLKTVPEPEYNPFNLLSQNVIKLPQDGYVLVQSRGGKQYPVQLAQGCEYNMNELRNAPKEAKVKAYLVTHTDPWMCMKIQVELPNPDEFDEDDCIVSPMMRVS